MGCGSLALLARLSLTHTRPDRVRVENSDRRAESRSCVMTRTAIRLLGTPTPCHTSRLSLYRYYLHNSLPLDLVGTFILFASRAASTLRCLHRITPQPHTPFSFTGICRVYHHHSRLGLLDILRLWGILSISIPPLDAIVDFIFICHVLYIPPSTLARLFSLAKLWHEEHPGEGEEEGGKNSTTVQLCSKERKRGEKTR